MAIDIWVRWGICSPRLLVCSRARKLGGGEGLNPECSGQFRSASGGVGLWKVGLGCDVDQQPDGIDFDLGQTDTPRPRRYHLAALYSCTRYKPDH
jgi:hypothetical protein